MDTLFLKWLLLIIFHNWFILYGIDLVILHRFVPDLFVVVKVLLPEFIWFINNDDIIFLDYNFSMLYKSFFMLQINCNCNPIFNFVFFERNVVNVLLNFFKMVNILKKTGKMTVDSITKRSLPM